MKTTQKIIPLFLMVVLAVSCGKNQKTGVGQNATTTAHGRLLDAATLEPIAGGKITLWRAGIKFKDTLSAADGSYRFAFPTNYDYFHKLSAEADHYLTNHNIGAWPEYYPTGRPTAMEVVDVGEDNQMDIKLPPEGFVRYVLRQVKPYSGSIQVRIVPRNANTVVTFNGQGLDTEYVDRQPGGANHRILCSIIWDGDSLQSFSDTLFVPRFDTLTYIREF